MARNAGSGFGAVHRVPKIMYPTLLYTGHSVRHIFGRGGEGGAGGGRAAGERRKEHRGGDPLLRRALPVHGAVRRSLRRGFQAAT
jgi:hypothetical protein